METQLKLIKAFFRTLSVVLPGIAAKLAFRLFQTTRRKKMSSDEREFYQKAERFIICHEKEDIIAYRMGNPKGIPVFLVHGWESNAGSMAGIAYTLVQCGFNVISFDLPAHGYSRLRRTNLIECFEAFKAVLDYFKPTGFSVISHSFGSAVTSYTLSHTTHQPDQLVFLTSPDRVLDIFSDFRKLIGLGNRAYQQFLKEVNKIVPEPLEEVSVHLMGRKIRYNNLLIIHDRFDKIIPFESSVKIYNELDRATLDSFEKIGHYRMLWNHNVFLSILDHWKQHKITHQKIVA